MGGWFRLGGNLGTVLTKERNGCRGHHRHSKKRKANDGSSFRRARTWKWSAQKRRERTGEEGNPSIFRLFKIEGFRAFKPEGRTVDNSRRLTIKKQDDITKETASGRGVLLAK